MHPDFDPAFAAAPHKRPAHDDARAPQVRADNLQKVYGEGETGTVAVDDVSAAFARGEFTAIVGPSGSGKTTLLHLLAGLDQPTAGRVQIDGVDLQDLDDDDLTDLRRDRVGFIFQDFNLLPTLTARQNIELPFALRRAPVDRAQLAQVAQLLGIQDRLDFLPSHLSGGQQQRVAVARALLGRPAVIFADEPTGALDVRSGKALLETLREAASRHGQTIVMVTHDPVAAGYADRVLVMTDYRLVADLAYPSPHDVIEALTAHDGSL
jgi:putative ABC transport system ATP-binding protein